MLLNKDLRKEIAWMTWHSKEGHIPSAYSIIDIVNFLFTDFLKINLKNANSVNRDSFVLSKGHGYSALYSV
jgi:transketolase